MEKNSIPVRRSFLRLSKLQPTQFRVLLHGMTYNTRWTPATCARECGLAIDTVQRALRALIEAGYAYTTPHPVNRNLCGYRFRLQPNVPDEHKPWYAEMMRQNNGNIDGIAFGPRIDDGKWKERDTNESHDKRGEGDSGSE